MIYIPVIIVITTILIDLYFTSNNRMIYFKKDNKVQEPWDKIEYNNITKSNKYYIKINHSSDDDYKHIKKLKIWKELQFTENNINQINYKNYSDYIYIIFNCMRESDALVLCNLVINNLNNNITLDEIITNNLIKSNPIGFIYPQHLVIHN